MSLLFCLYGQWGGNGMKQFDELAVFFRFDIAVSKLLLMFPSTLLFLFYV